MQVPLLVMRRVVISKLILNPDYCLLLLLKAQKGRANVFENIFIGWGLLLSPKFRSILKNVAKMYPAENWSVRKRRFMLLSLMQLMLLMAIIFTLFHVFSNNTEAWNTINIEKGHLGSVILPDGSTVNLNASSLLKVSAKYNKDRIILLDGEGYFKFKQAGKQRAIIKTHVAEISGGGNALNVSTYDNNLTIACLEGTVPVKIKNGHRMLLKPGFALTYNFDDRSWITVNVSQDTVTSWMQGVYYIDEKKLESICKQIERVYNVIIVFDRPNYKNFSFTGKFRKDDSINVILENLSQAGGMKYSLDKARIVHWQ